MEENLDFKFRNRQLSIEDIPTVSDVRFSHLKPAYRWVLIGSQLIFLTIIWFVFLLILIFAQLWSYEYLWIIIGLISIYSLLALIVSVLAYKRKTYAVREKDMLYNSGVFWKEKIAIPFSRVQHSEVKRGPLDELFDISKLQIFTAGGSASDLTIPGLDPKVAENLRNFILRKVDEFDEEE